jgi:hypothetical protein
VRLERLWAATGLLCVALFGCGLLFGDVVASDPYPRLDEPASAVRRYFLDNEVEVRALAFFHMLSAIALLLFAVYLRRIAPLAVAGGVTAAAFLFLSALFFRTLAEPAVAGDASVTHALLVLSYLAGGPGISVPLAPLIGAASVAARRNALLPSWICWLGFVAAPVSLASAAVVLGPARNTSALFSLLLIAAGLGFLWLLAASVALVRTPHGVRPSTQVSSPA